MTKKKTILVNRHNVTFDAISMTTVRFNEFGKPATERVFMGTGAVDQGQANWFNDQERLANVRDWQVSHVRWIKVWLLAKTCLLLNLAASLQVPD